MPVSRVHLARMEIQHNAMCIAIALILWPLNEKALQKIFWSIVIECNQCSEFYVQYMNALGEYGNGLSQIIAEWTTPTNVDTHYTYGLRCSPERSKK